MKNLKKILLILILFVILLYVSNISSIPNNLILMQGEHLNVKTLLGLSISDINGETIEAVNSDDTKVSNKIGKVDLSVNLAGFSVKDLTVNVIPNTVVIPSGETIGLRLYTSGVLVVGMSEIQGQDNNNYTPYKNSGIKEGDMITRVDDEAVTCTSDLITKVNESNGNTVKITYVRDGSNYNTEILPTKTSDNEYKLGLWVRDAASGVGTISFYDPKTGEFGALGHGILDVDTEELIDIARGDIVTSKIVSIVKGEKGKPGELQGSIDNGKIIGEVYKNTNFGIYGKINNVEELNQDSDMVNNPEKGYGIFADTMLKQMKEVEEN